MSEMEFSDWITKKYIQWRGDAIGQARTISEFASWVGVSQSLMSYWMKKGGKTPKAKQSIDKLAKRFPEIYSVLGIPEPDPSIPRDDLPIESLPPAMREALFSATRELADTLTEKRINPDSDEAEALTVSIMGKHGFIWTKTEKEGSTE